MIEQRLNQRYRVVHLEWKIERTNQILSTDLNAKMLTDVISIKSWLRQNIK
jgi:hypothetical protein